MIDKTINKHEKGPAETDAWYKDFVDNASDLVQCVDSEGKFIYVNQAWLSTLKYAAKDIDKITVFDIIHPDSMERCIAAFKQVLTAKTLGQVGAVFAAKDGTPIAVEGSVSVQLDEKGRFVHTRGIFRDVSAHKQAEEALQQEKTFQAILLDLATDFINVPLSEFDRAIDDMLQIIGEFTGLDRAYLFRHDYQRRVTSNTHEWCRSGITPEKENLQDIPFDAFSEWWKVWEKGDIVHIPSVAQMPRKLKTREILEAQGIQSLAVIPLVEDMVITGFVGFDAVNECKSFSEREITLLLMLAEIISNTYIRKRAEEDIRALKTFNENIVQNIAEGVIISDLNGMVTFANPALLKMLGYSAEEFIGSHWTYIVPPQYNALIEAADARRLEGKADRYELLLKHKNGALLPFQVSGSPYYNHATREIDGTMAVLTDISERKQIELMLKQSEEQYRTLYENIPIGVYRSTPGQEGRFLLANPGFMQIFGIKSKEELEKLKVADLYQEPAERAIFSEKLTADGHLKGVERRLKRLDGSPIWGSITAQTVYNEDGKAAWFDCTIEDITERKQAEETLKKREEEYQRLYSMFRIMSDTMPDMLWAKDLDRKYIFANRAICKKLLSAKNTTEPIGKNDLYFANREREAHPEEPDWHTFGELCMDSDTITLNEMKPLQFDEYGNVKGKFLYLDVRKAPLFNSNGELIGVVGTARDVTDQKRKEEILRNSEQRAKKQRVTIAELVLDESIVKGDKAAALDKITSVSANAFDVERSSIWTLDESGEELKCLSLYEAKSGTLSSGAVLQAKKIPRYFAAIKKESRIYAENAQQDPRTSELKENYLKPLGITSILDAGIIIDGEIRGVICLEHVGSPRLWQADEEAFASTVASIVAQLFVVEERECLFETLKQSEAKHRFLTENITDAVWTTDLNGKLTYMSPSIERLTGFTPTELMNMSMHEYFVQEDLNNMMARLANEIAKPPGKRAHSAFMEARLRTKDNRLVPVELHGSWIVDGKGNIIGVQGSTRNITDRKLAEEILQQEKAFQEILLDLAADFINVPLGEFNRALGDMLGKIGEFTKSDRVCLFLHDNERKVTSNMHEWCREGIASNTNNLQEIPFDLFSDMRETWEKGDLVEIPSVDQMPKEHPMHKIFLQQGIQSLVQIPLMQNQVNTGFVGFGAVNECKLFSKQEISLLRVLAEIISNAIARKETEEILADRLVFEKMLSKISAYFVTFSAEQFDDKVLFALQTVAEMYDVDRSYVYCFSEDGKTYSNTHLWCKDGVEGYFEKNQDFPVERTPWWINELQSGRRVSIADVTTMPEEAALDQADFLYEGIKSIITFPLVWGGKVFGCFGFDTVKEHRFWTEKQLNLLQVVSELITGAIVRHDAARKIHLLSFHDQLTGLYNRHFLEEEMKRLDTKRQLPISIIMADLNGLKLVNDTYGHQTGDKMLKRTAEVLKNTCRDDDLIARYGGDEFTIYLTRTPEEEANKIRDRIEKACRAEKKNDVPLSISMGVAVKVSAEQELSAVLKAAEDRMYQEKLTESRSGKSAIVNTLLQTLAAKSYETETHILNMQEAAHKIGEKLGLPSSELHRLNLLILLHDIGKINISDELLNKKEALTETEWEMMNKHSEIGYRIARATDDFVHVADDILAHHEHWNGSGYPKGLKGEAIPLLARITAIVDAYEVMSNGRPYTRALSRSEIMAELKRCSGAQFDPALLELFLSILEKDGNK